MRLNRGRYCRITTCPNFAGAKKSTPMFNAPPAYDPLLRDKWVRWLRSVEPKFDERMVGSSFTLCDLHFDIDDMRHSGKRCRLVPGSIPKYFIPHPDPLAAIESEVGDDLMLKDTPENPQQSSETIEVAFDKDMTNNESKKPKKLSYCKKCIQVNVDVQFLNVKLARTENRLTNQKSIIDSLRNMLSELKNAQKSTIPNSDACLICNKKFPTGSLYEHLCIETDDEDGSIKCAYCTRSFKATIALTEHLKCSHMTKSHAVSCNECDQHYAMKELLQVHMMAKHKKKLTEPIRTQSIDLISPIPMPVNETNTQTIELETEILQEPVLGQTVEMSIEELESSESLETSLESQQVQKRMKLDGVSSTYTEYSYLSDEDDIDELLPSIENSNEIITNQVTKKPQLRRIKIIKKKNTIELTDVSEDIPVVGETVKITVEPLPIPLNENSPLLKPYECGYSCGERFAKPQELNKHMKQKHGKGGGIHLECYQCHDTFVKITDLRNHLSEFHDNYEKSKNKSKLCDQCGQICKTKKLMELHYKKHANEAINPKRIKSLNGKPYCDICKISFNASVTYWRHTLKHRPDEGKKLKCSYCPMRCVHQRQLTDHIRSHTLEKPFQCDYCEPKRLFRYKRRLTDHLRTHFGQKVYGCEIENCNERFRYHKELQEHLKNDHV